MKRAKVIIFIEQENWHTHVLKKAFSKKGIAVKLHALKDCLVDISQDYPMIRFIDDTSFPHLVFVKEISGGTIQQITQRLTVLHLLERQGVLVYNSAKTIEKTIDKGMTSFLLKQNGINTPETWVCESRFLAENLLAEELNKGDLVLKPLLGSQGQGIRRLTLGDQPPVPQERHLDGVYYFQRFVGECCPQTALWRSYRIFVIGGKARAGMMRVSKNWVSNFSLGAECLSLNLTKEEQMVALAEKASLLVQGHYLGIDFIKTLNGQIYVLEINSLPAWRGLQSVCSFSIADLLVADCLRMLP